MHSYEPFMFHKAYPLESFLEEAKMMEKEKERMFSYLPEEYRKMQRKVEEICDGMEYEGSRMYDEHPDSGVIRKLARKILKQLEEENPEEFHGSEMDKEGTGPEGICQAGRYQEDMVCCFLCNEILHRRYRTWRSKQYIR